MGTADQHDVGGFNVTMDNALCMGLGEPVCNLADNVHRFLDSQILLCNLFLKACALQVFHGNIGKVFGIAAVIDGDDSRMRKRAGRMGLPQEPLVKLLIGTKACFDLDGFDGNHTVDFWVCGWPVWLNWAVSFNPDVVPKSIAVVAPPKRIL